MRLSHKIGGINFSFESNIAFNLFRGSHFDFFLESNSTPDVFHFVTKTNHHLNKTNKGSILDSSLIKNKISQLVDSNDQFDIWVDKNQVIIKNFSKNEIYVYYNEDFWGYDPIRKKSNSDFRVFAEIRELYPTFLPSFSAIMLHSSGVVIDNHAVLFLAPSGGGKSTVIDNFTGDCILSDDQTIIKRAKTNNGFDCYSTPFGRITSGSFSAKLSGLFLLEKSEKFSINIENNRVFLEYLWATQVCNTIMSPRDFRQRTFQLIYDICKTIPTYRMKFPKNFVDWDAIIAVMK